MQLCPHCGAPSRGGPTCASCGRAYAPLEPAPKPVAPQPPVPPAAQALVHAPAPPSFRAAPSDPRPLGVLLVGIGFFLLALGCVIFALFMMTFGPAVGAAMTFIPFVGGPFGAAMAMFAFFLGLMALVVGGLVAVVGWGVLEGKSWAWAATLAVAALGALASLLQVADADFDGVLGVLAWGGVAYYFWRPETRAWFGRPA